VEDGQLVGVGVEAKVAVLLLDDFKLLAVDGLKGDMFHGRLCTERE
jgi:hypothetical protein